MLLKETRFLDSLAFQTARQKNETVAPVCAPFAAIQFGASAGQRGRKLSSLQPRWIAQWLRANLSACDRSERDAGCHKGDLVVGKNDSHVAENRMPKNLVHSHSCGFNRSLYFERSVNSSDERESAARVAG
jgi:hypothetical protein